jgi:hypothetical protein
MTVDRSDWSKHVESVVRSRHYTWLPEGLGGGPVDEAMAYIVADVMHVCKMAGIPWEDVLSRSHDRFNSEETEFHA